MSTCLCPAQEMDQHDDWCERMKQPEARPETGEFEDDLVADFYAWAEDFMHEQSLGELAREYVALFEGHDNQSLIAWALESDLAEAMEAREVSLEAWCTCGNNDPDRHVDKDFKEHKRCMLWDSPWADRTYDWDPGFGVLYEPTPQKKECECSPSKLYYCATCGVERAKMGDPWEPIVDKKPVVPLCRHYSEALVLPDSVKIYVSSQYPMTAALVPEGLPEIRFGLYASSTWRPDHIHTMIPWDDYGLPRCSYTHAYDTIVEHHGVAKDGHTLQVGCVGGHGRTGTIVACMAVIAGLDPVEAVTWTRNTHCKKAIEDESQEWFVRWFAAHHLGLPFDEPKPVKKPSTWYSSGTKVDPGQGSLFSKSSGTEGKVEKTKGSETEFDPFLHELETVRSVLGSKEGR